MNSVFTNRFLNFLLSFREIQQKKSDKAYHAGVFITSERMYGVSNRDGCKALIEVECRSEIDTWFKPDTQLIEWLRKMRKARQAVIQFKLEDGRLYFTADDGQEKIDRNVDISMHYETPYDEIKLGKLIDTIPLKGMEQEIVSANAFISKDTERSIGYVNIGPDFIIGTNAHVMFASELKAKIAKTALLPIHITRCFKYVKDAGLSLYHGKNRSDIVCEIKSIGISITYEMFSDRITNVAQAIPDHESQYEKMTFDIKSLERALKAISYIGNHPVLAEYSFKRQELQLYTTNSTDDHTSWVSPVKCTTPVRIGFNRKFMELLIKAHQGEDMVDLWFDKSSSFRDGGTNQPILLGEHGKRPKMILMPVRLDNHDLQYHHLAEEHYFQEA